VCAHLFPHFRSTLISSLFTPISMSQSRSFVSLSDTSSFETINALGGTLTYIITLPEPTYQPDVASSYLPRPLQSQIEASTTERLLGSAHRQETWSLETQYDEVHLTSWRYPYAVRGSMEEKLWSFTYTLPEGCRRLRVNDLMRSSRGKILGRYLGIEGLHGEHLILHLLVVEKVRYVDTNQIRCVLWKSRSRPFSPLDSPPPSLPHSPYLASRLPAMLSELPPGHLPPTFFLSRAVCHVDSLSRHITSP